MDNTVTKIIIGVIVVFFIAKTCGRNRNTSSSVAETWQKSPVDQLIKDLNKEANFSIVLFDMDADEGSISSDNYRHQYQIIIERPDTVLEQKTGWKNVSEAFFSQNINNMGMEIVSKKDGVITKQAVPAGYNHYVGNEKYGRWENRGGSSFWAFYGQYAFMSSMFNMMSYRRSYWNDYRTGGYYGSSRGYYGPRGSSPVFGTKSYTGTSAGRSSKWGNKTSTFKNKVRSRVSRSSSSYNRKRTSTRTTRSSSRYRRSSTRSRSGGFGK
ncbi:hypothetical protein [Ancylomarina longa]|uniref:DUF4247 domain-containing protein n=1 Tax=Ancylomarina longa TaxID=2487017 RepID=A0A434AUF9_9BACT|nr:hypothetical protein [Ancylomarina longa]RUT78060.1 hypothetical protein DLK05_10475 [Ancylomarina longa]